MVQPLVLLVSLVLVLSCRVNALEAPDFCRNRKCPQYELIEKTEVFEKRLYVATNWISTKISSTSRIDILAANFRLKEYCKQNGQEICDDAWPVLITVTKEFWLSWFVPGTEMPKETDHVITQNKPEATVYVRSFSGTPSIESGKTNAEALWRALDKNCTDFPTYSGAGYESYFAVEHHNEIWIYADDICKNAE